MRSPVPVLLICLLAALVACGEPAPDDLPAAELEREVLTTFQPTRWMAEALLGGAVPVTCLLPEDADAVHWRPSRDVLARLQRARLVVLHGAGLEAWVDTANLPASRTVDLSAGLEASFLERAGGDTHSHGMTGEHSHAGLDPHLWLDPVLAGEQLEALRAALTRTFPELASEIDARAVELRDELTALDAGWTRLAEDLGDACLFAAHPAYDYLAARYGLTITSFDLDPQESEPGEVVEVLRRAGGGAGCLLLWESAPRPETAQALRLSLDVESVVVDPGEGCQPGATPDVLESWRANLARLDEALP